MLGDVFHIMLTAIIKYTFGLEIRNVENIKQVVYRKEEIEIDPI